ncbi:MAG TPA: trypsin-like serine protease [Opitutus sp.]|nr:trypsin-like serine protease [Opitutus sp.]
MKTSLRTILAAATIALLALANPARALTVYGYDSATDERFTSGFPSSPVENPSFFLSGYDLSGIGWEDTGHFGVTLISSQYALTAAHVAPAPGSTLDFVNADGALKQYTVDTSYVLTHPNSQNTDLVLVRLTQPIAASDHVTSYPTLLLPTIGSYIGAPVAAFGAGQRAGTNIISDAGAADLLPFGSGNGTADDYLFVTDYDAVTGDTQAQSGDSGSPTFTVVNGSLVLLGTHSAISTSGSPAHTYDVLAPAYYTEINQYLQLDSQSWSAYVVSAIPEPAATATFAGLVALGSWWARRRRSRV